MEISLCMIVRNEQEHLAACLESAAGAVDEIIIVDTGSTDATKEIAARFTQHVYDYVWQDDFAAARNASLQYAAKPFILWLDADDVLDPPEREKLIRLKAQLHDAVDAVMLPYHYAFDERGEPALVFERERIVRRAAGFRFTGAVHEVMAVSGHIIHGDVIIRHTGRHGQSSCRRNLGIYEKLLARGETLAPRDRYYYARELKNVGDTERALKEFEAFLEMDGWIENRIDAYIQRGECLVQLGRGQEAKRSYLLSMLSGSPRAQALCAMGACMMEEGDLPAAAHWYASALLCSERRASVGFMYPAYSGYTPLMQLCVICSRMGNDYLASQMNEQALLLRPGDPAAMSNRVYFSERLKEQMGAQTQKCAQEENGQGA